MLLITRKAEFSASHYCASPALSPEENEQLFGVPRILANLLPFSCANRC